MDALRNMHKAFLEALRHREQEILQYLAFVGPALAGFVWLMTLDYGKNAWVFVVGTLGIILLLFLGACYSLALGYNYRYLTLQMAKIESPLGLNIVEQILNRWPRRKADFDKYTYRCNPPNIIYTFWVACMVGILLITILGVSAVAGQELSRLGTWPSSEVTVSVGGAPDHTDVRTEVREVVPRGHLAVRASLALGRVAVVGFAGLTCLLVAWLLPRRYGTKMKDLLDKEPPEWKPGGEA
jgi:hypothetical protein